MSQPVSHNKLGKMAQLEVIPSFRKKLYTASACLSLLVILNGCTSTEVTKRDRLVTEKLPRPSKILVCDFAATPADVPKDSSVAAHTSAKSPAQSPEAVAAGRKLGASIASELVEQIRGMGLPAEKASSKTKMQVNDILIRGYLLSVSQGDTVKRVVVGFGYGSSELETAVEGYQMTAKGLRKLGSAKLKSEGGKTPGGALGAVSMIANANPAGLIVGGAVKGYGEYTGNTKVEGLGRDTAKEIADQLRIRFKEEGWIK